MENIITQLNALIQLAISDQNFDKTEKQLIYSIGKANSVKEVEINDLIQENLMRKHHQDLSFSVLTFEQKFEYLYDIIQLMKIDSKVYLSEIRYCEQMAEKLGFDKSVVKKLSSRIYSDPSITSNREMLMKEAKKFEL